MRRFLPSFPWLPLWTINLRIQQWWIRDIIWIFFFRMFILLLLHMKPRSYKTPHQQMPPTNLPPVPGYFPVDECNPLYHLIFRLLDHAFLSYLLSFYSTLGLYSEYISDNHFGQRSTCYTLHRKKHAEHFASLHKPYTWTSFACFPWPQLNDLISLVDPETVCTDSNKQQCNMAFWDQDYSEQTIIDIILLVVIFDVFWKEITFNNTIMESCRLVKIYIPSSHNYSAKTFNPFLSHMNVHWWRWTTISLLSI